MSTTALIDREARVRALQQRYHRDDARVCEIAVSVVARATSATRDELLGSDRAQPLPIYRGWLFWLLRHRAGWALKQIGRATGFDHSTVIEALRRTQPARCGAHATRMIEEMGHRFDVARAREAGIR